jgi:glycosyltransferase involved in cell wall biosynthesis
VDDHRTLRVLFLAPDLRIGGAERQWEHLLPGLRELDVDCRVLTIKQRGAVSERLAARGVPVTCLRDSPLRGLRELLRSTDVVVARATNAHVLAWLLRTLRGTPYVVVEHTHYDLRPPTWRRRALLRMLAPRARAVVAVTESQCRPLYAIGYPPSTVTVIPNGVPDEASTCARPGPSGGPVTFTLVAGLRPEKRIDDFVDLVDRLASEGHDVRGVVAGGGEQLTALRARADDRGAPVRFLGEVADPVPVWRSADVACLTSEHEALPLSLLEAMSFGLPLLVTDVGANATLCEHGTNGFVHAVGDVDGMVRSAARLVTEPDLRAAMGAHSRTRYQTAWSAQAMTRAYGRLLHTSAHRPHPADRVRTGRSPSGSG